MRIVGKRVMDVRVGLIEGQVLVDFRLHGINKTIGFVGSVGSEIIGNRGNGKQGKVDLYGLSLLRIVV